MSELNLRELDVAINDVTAGRGTHGGDSGKKLRELFDLANARRKRGGWDAGEILAAFPFRSGNTAELRLGLERWIGRPALYFTWLRRPEFEDEKNLADHLPNVVDFARHSWWIAAPRRDANEIEGLERVLGVKRKHAQPETFARPEKTFRLIHGVSIAVATVDAARAIWLVFDRDLSREETSDLRTIGMQVFLGLLPALFVRERFGIPAANERR